MKITLQAICVKIDRSKGNLDQLKEVEDFLKTNDSLFEPYQNRFMKEHLQQAIDEATEEKKNNYNWFKQY